MLPKPTEATERKERAGRASRWPLWLAATVELALGVILVTSTGCTASIDPGRRPPTATPLPTAAPAATPTMRQGAMAVVSSQAARTQVEAQTLPTASVSISPRASLTPHSAATSTQTPSSIPPATQTPTEPATCTPAPTRSPTQDAQAVETRSATPPYAQITITIEDLDEEGLACSSLVLFKGNEIVQRVGLRDALDPRRVVVPGDSADWLKFEGGADGRCPWDNWNMADGDPNRVPILSEEVTLRFVPTPDEPRPT
jgi:hypothetical protein